MKAEGDVFRRRPGLAWRDEEAARREVLILVDSGQVFELNLLGADIWKLCDGARTVGEIVDDLLDRYDVGRNELEEDVRTFLSQMVEKGWMLQV
jgi:pyrroloquinoline quinone biosynthesis protein D